MESTFCSENEGPCLKKSLLYLHKRKDQRSASPVPLPFKSVTRLPPFLNSKSAFSPNITPPPRASPLKLGSQNPSASRIHSIIKRNLFPSISPKAPLPRAPSVNDIEPLFMKSYHPDIVTCKKCNQTSVVLNKIHLAEYKIWGKCTDCQNLVFSTSLNSENNDTLSFKNTGEFYEFSLGANIEFWLDGKNWQSLSEYFSGFHQKVDAEKAVKQKVLQHPRLEQLLVSTGNRELIYFLPDNGYWGIEFNGIGSNQLGKILMEVRSEILRYRKMPFGNA